MKYEPEPVPVKYEPEPVHVKYEPEPVHVKYELEPNDYDNTIKSEVFEQDPLADS